MNKNTIIIILSAITVFLFMCIYERTPYFDNTTGGPGLTLILKNGKEFYSTDYYRDLGGNWILLDKEVAIRTDSLARVENGNLVMIFKD